MVTTFVWIIGSGILMSAIALSGSLTLLMSDRTIKRLVLPLVAFAAGSLMGGAFLHMLPAASQTMESPMNVALWTLGGFTTFFALEQFLHWHHCHRASADCRQPLTYLILLGDGLHNLLGGIAVAGAFITDIRLGVTTWLAAAAHEVPQELGDFGVLVHGGWPKRRALLVNLLSGLTFLVGGLLAWGASTQIDIAFLLPFAAGNFIYIGASDLVPEVTHSHSLRTGIVHSLSFGAGVTVLILLRVWLEH